MPELAPEAFDECGRGRAIVRELLVAHLAEDGRERIDLTDRRRSVVLHVRIEAASARRVRAEFVSIGRRRRPRDAAPSPRGYMSCAEYEVEPVFAMFGQWSRASV